MRHCFKSTFAVYLTLHYVTIDPTLYTNRTDMSEYIIGIDTGGTYTDAVLLDRTNNTVLATAKVPTNHRQLALSTAQALESLLQKSDIDAKQVSRLALSTTLATNAVIENKGARVAAFVIGYVKHFKLPITATIFIKGGHNIMGKEEEPLDLNNIVDTIQGLKNEVDAYAVCSAMSMKDPSHEMVTEKSDLHDGSQASVLLPHYQPHCRHAGSNSHRSITRKVNAAHAGLCCRCSGSNS